MSALWLSFLYSSGVTPQFFLKTFWKCDWMEKLEFLKQSGTAYAGIYHYIVKTVAAEQWYEVSCACDFPVGIPMAGQSRVRFRRIRTSM